ncbi:uncharacterized protein PHACADRAFT_151791 [Phanerochaete carnosa HHB-10118-sp]|uniref:Uncharacterized protein n=1 Tax=Phanerochaete carnosa (strain HHB-10118-sp) TaxID=650164 RepID=K5WLM6_PHACS|nr:uncharacterized protein PHACADRAFT_151791 [Phanerochaete carnosa HHB-10118-sp]EKM51197.1 hypothetical protein PHACADRAFT_151791 [Phanerochaete carnosa HHB-10118-sp]
MPPKVPATSFLWSLCILAVVLIFIIPPSSLVLIPTAVSAWKTGWLPDGLPLRRFYTGFVPLDFIFMVYGGVSGAAVDGNDEATHLFCLWFLPQLCTVLLFTYWEAGRAKSGLAIWPTFVCILAQFLTAGVTLPAYFVSHIHNISSIPTLLPADALTRVKTILPAIILGYLVPSWFLVFPPKGVSLDTVQKISAAWQPFPLYTAAFWALFRKVDLSAFGPSAGPHQDASRVLIWLSRSYYVCGLIAAWAHLYVFVPSLFATESSHSFANIFIPFWLHPYLPISLPAGSLAAYRPCSRLLFQHDWLIMTIAILTFFARSHLHMRTGFPSMGIESWAFRMLFISIVGGPGAALAWAAVKREEKIASAQNAKNARKLTLQEYVFASDCAHN